MSSSSSQPENAAPSAPLTLPVRPVPVSDAEAPPEHADNKVSGQRAQHDATPVSIRARDPELGSNKDDIKNRGSGHPQRQAGGPSLLSQALASARGIPSTSKPANVNTNNSNNSSSVHHGSKNNNIKTSSSINNSSNQQNEAAGGARSAKLQSNGHPRIAEKEREVSNSALDDANRSRSVKDGVRQASLDRNSAQPASAMATSATLPTTPAVSALPPRDAASAAANRPHSFKQPSLAHAREILMEHRDFLDRAQGRASTSLELDHSATDSFKSRAFSLTASPEESTTPTSTSYLRKGDALTLSGSSNDTSRDSNSRSRTRPTLEQKMTTSPEKTEKIWSIGSGDGKDEDGLVEKSVAEAMAGVEHNTRSRKASYSLRFFKEGLPPEDKPRRKEKDKDKETKTTSRDRLSPTFEESSAQATHTSAKSTKSSHQPSPVGPPKDSRGSSHSNHEAATDYFNLETTAPTASGKEIVAPSTQLPESHEAGMTIRHAKPPSEVGPTPAPGAEGVEGLRQRSPDGRHHHVPTKTGAGAGAGVGARIVGDDKAEARAKAPDGAEAEAEAKVDVRPDADAEAGADGEADTEDADESGEEKISSAVFLPHQEVPEARATAIDILGQSQAQRPRSISHSSSHPWLVKADEPEPEPELLDKDDDARTPVEPSPLRQREKPVSHPAEQRHVQPDETVVADEHDVISQAQSKPATVAVTQQEEHNELEEAETPEPLEAIELIPYKHQVGGHTTIWRFSRRAVCKQLNNRENEFYETIERYHRDLLPFLPRYIGVLNVTFQKQPRRKSTAKKEDTATIEPRPTAEEAVDDTMSNGTDIQSKAEPCNVSVEVLGPPRIVSQSLANASFQIPTVTFDNNKHILPRNLLQPTPPPEFFRRRSTSSSKIYTHASKVSSQRPLMDERPNSWGATTINKRLRNEVFNDAFLKEPVEVQKHRRPHQRAVPRPTMQRLLRATNSDPNLVRVGRSHEEEPKEEPIQTEPPTPVVAPTIPAQPLVHVHSHDDLASKVDLGPRLEPSNPGTVKDLTGTSAPEPEILKANAPTTRKKRRYSAGGLRRRPEDVRESRGDLKYFEEADDADYKPESEAMTEGHEKHSHSAARVPPLDPIQSTATSAAPSALPSPTAEFRKIPRPINPKEAKSQRDRVEYFLLMEDLTAGMKRPCMMDLKMGTRQYGVDATVKKQKSQSEKCRTTTSAELGVRICGLQVWNVETQSYEFQDKYFGRKLKAGAEFQAALQKFLYNGVDLDSVLGHIPVVLKKLAQLEQIIRGLRGYRFYAASLLMFYDGDRSDEAAYDTMYDSTTDVATDTEETTRRKRRNPREIDFKMADFANSLTPFDDIHDKACPPLHPDEPDLGFLKGLKSLRRYFLQIQADVRAELGLGRQGARAKRGWTSGQDDEFLLDFDDAYDDSYNGSISL